jgi:hypothetical protein
MGLAAIGVAGTAAAQPKCSTDLSTTNVIYVSGSSALEPLYKAIGPVLANQPTPYALVYAKDGSCNGVQKFVDFNGGKTKLASTAQVFYIDATYNPAVGPQQCTLSDQVNGVTVDLSFSDVFVEVCSGATRPNDTTDILGPAQAMTFVTHPNSAQQAISAEQAYLALGLGAAGGATPWIDPNYFFIRPDSSGTKQLLAAAIKVKASLWKGIFLKNPTDPTSTFGTNDVRDHVNSSGNPDATLGIMGAADVDAGTNRQKVKELAFRAYNQKRAYWPDSTPSAFDKRNVREGLYVPFGYVHLVGAITAGSANTVDNLTNPKAKLVAQIVTQAISLVDTSTGQPVDLIKVIGATAHLIPQCAMKVSRTQEAGDLSNYDPPKRCFCAYEALWSSAGGDGGTVLPPGCTPCTTTCTGGEVCNNGFCEAH